MQRREFITLLGGAAWSVVAWRAAYAQQPGPQLIGVLSSSTAAALVDGIPALHQGLRDAGYAEGRNLRVEYRWAEGVYDRLPAMAADLVQRKVSVIVAVGDSAWTAKEATASIPIVFANGSDPVESGLVPSLSRPDGNVTGASWTSNPLMPKRLELLRDLVPQLSSIGALVNPGNPSAAIDIRAIEAGARGLGLKLDLHKASTIDEVTAAFATMAERKVDAVLMGADSFFSLIRDQIVALVVGHRLPASHPVREDVLAGGLMSYAPRREDSLRLAGVYAGRILKGERPADLPVQLPTRFQLAINLRTARTLGVSIPETFLLRADEVIE
jgi:putative ABC transport system substrate-binding protein